MEADGAVSSCTPRRGSAGRCPESVNEAHETGAKVDCLASGSEIRSPRPSRPVRMTSATELDSTADEFGDVPLGGATTLTEEQQLGLFHSQVNMMIENEKYLRLHAELGEMLGLFMTKVLEEKPDDVLTFAGEFFTQDDLQELVEAQIGDESTFGVLDGKLQDV